MPSIKVPPHDIDVEQSILGAILIDKDALLHITDILFANNFYDNNHQEIFSAMIKLFETRDPIDVLTLSSELKKNKKFDAIGGAGYLSLLAEKVPTSAHIKKYATIVRDLFIKRELIRIGSEIVDSSFDESRNTEEVLDKAELSIFKVSQSNVLKSFRHIRDTLADSFERLENLHNNPGGLRGLPTGFKDLDDMLAGFQNSNLIILAARPGMGKTALALNIMQHAGVKEKVPVGIFSLEMSQEELVDRLLVGEADIDAWRLKTGHLKEDDFSRISDAMGRLAEAPIFIDDTPGISLMEMRTKARRLYLENGVKMIIIDYLQLATTNQKYESRVQEVSQISLAMKNLARELKIPVLCLSQLSRAVEARGTKEPQLSDLRESGSIEQDADVVMFIYREDEEIRENVTLKIAKHRNGSVGNVPLYFKGDRVKFFGMEQVHK